MTKDQDTVNTNAGAGATPGFEQALARLESIVDQLEDGELALADSLARYEEGVGLLRQCYSLLQRAERRVEQLCAVDPRQMPVTEPFCDEPTADLETKVQSRSRRRTSRRTEEASAGDEPSSAPPRGPEPRELF